MKILSVMLLGASLAGCSTLSDEYRIKLLETQQNVANKPLIELECPSSGCYIQGLTVNNTQKVTLGTSETNGYDVINKVVDGVTGAIPFAAIGHTVNRLGNTSTSQISTVTNSTETAVTNTRVIE